MIYDVVDDRRRNRLFKLLKQYGLPLQKSAFEARLERGERKRLLIQVENLIDPKMDSFVMYSIGKEAEEKIVALGYPRPKLETPSYYIV